MQQEKRKATIVDVAKRAGVSVATVSRVVNANYPVKKETRERVEKAIDELAYVPNVQARELNMRRSSTIGVVLPSLYNMFFAQVVDGIEDYLRQGSYSLLISCAKNDPQQEMRCITALVSRNVSGIIVVSPNTAGIKESFYAQLVRRRRSSSSTPTAPWTAFPTSATTRHAARRRHSAISWSSGTSAFFSCAGKTPTPTRSKKTPIASSCAGAA